MPEEHDWPESDLVRRLIRALTIAERAIDALGDSGYHDAAAPEDSFGPDKPLAETAMLLHVATRTAGRDEVDKRIASLLARVERLVHADRTAAAVALYPSIAWQLAMPHILLGRLGRSDPRFDQILDLSATAAAADGRELLPHRRLERLWLRALWVGGRQPAVAESEEALAASVLAHPVDLLLGARDDAYAFTHGLMYLTDFGAWTPALPRTRSEILGEASALLARALVLEDYDLATEVLMAWPLTGASWSDAAGFGFRVLAEFEDEVGYLLAGNGIPGRYHELTGRERTRYALAASYHTAYVWGILCALGLTSADPVPARLGTRGDPGVVDALRGLVPDTDTPWQRSFDRLQPDERLGLGPFLVDAALVSAAQRRDFAGLATVLRLAAHSGLANAPGCAQAAELLGRLTASQPAPADA